MLTSYINIHFYPIPQNSQKFSGYVASPPPDIFYLSQPNQEEFAALPLRPVTSEDKNYFVIAWHEGRLCRQRPSVRAARELFGEAG